MLFLVKEKNYPINSREILKQAFAQNPTSEPNFSDTKFLIGDFFEPYLINIDAKNCLYQYFIEDSTNDLVKQQKLDNILSGLTKYIDWLWHQECVSSFNQWVEFEFKDGLFNLPEYEGLRNDTMPSYWIYYFCKSINDIIWDRFRIFIDTKKHNFKHFYSNKEIETNGETIKSTKPVKTAYSKKKESLFENPFPDIFKTADTYLKFKRFAKECIVVDYLDYSYLIQRLKEEKLIHKMTHPEGINWLYENSFINHRQFDYFSQKNQLSSFKNCNNPEREKKFDNIFFPDS